MQKPKKLSSVHRKRRPKSIYSKGWETRRRNAKHRASPEGKLAQAIYGDNSLDALPGLKALTGIPSAAAMRGAEHHPGANQSTTGSTTQSHFEVYRDVQLCDFMGDMQAARHRDGYPSHTPMLVTRSQIVAIVDFLTDHGYSAFGKGSGLLMSVSTDPAA